MYLPGISKELYICCKLLLSIWFCVYANNTLSFSTKQKTVFIPTLLHHDYYHFWINIWVNITRTGIQCLVVSFFCRWKQYSCLHNLGPNKVSKNNLNFFNAPRVIIYPTYFSKLYLDPYYGDDKIGTQVGTIFPSW